jgi:hypothetical protein
MYLSIPKHRPLLLTVLLSLILFKYHICIGSLNPGGPNPWNVYYLLRRETYRGFSEKYEKDYLKYFGVNGRIISYFNI